MRTMTSNQGDSFHDSHIIAVANSSVVLNNNAVKHQVMPNYLIKMNGRFHYVVSVAYRNQSTGNHAFDNRELGMINRAVEDNGGVILYNYEENSIVVINDVFEFIKEVKSSRKRVQKNNRTVYLLNYCKMKEKYPAFC